jgi:hypothetical protein
MFVRLRVISVTTRFDLEDPGDTDEEDDDEDDNDWRDDDDDEDDDSEFDEDDDEPETWQVAGESLPGANPLKVVRT